MLFLVTNSKSDQDASGQLPVVHTVQRGPLQIDVSSSGTIENTEQVRVRSEVDGHRTILYLIPEGTEVKTGDLLFELDSAELEEKYAEQKIRVSSAESTFVQSREQYGITENAGLSNIERTRIEVKLAQLDLDKYLKGEYPQQLQQAENAITLADEELRRSQDKLAWSEKLATEGFVTRSELESDTLEVKRRKLNLDVARSNLSVLKKYSHIRTLEGLKSNLYQQEQSLIRVKKDASADLIRAEADLSRRESEFLREKTRLNYYNDQLKKCKVVAPADGMVIYATSINNDRNQEPLDAGQTVRTRQELIYLPSGGRMKSVFSIRESELQLIEVGMPAVVTIDALGGLKVEGVVTKIAPLPDQSSIWLNPNLKLYDTEVLLNEDVPALRAGMNSRVQIIAKEYQDVVYVPVQSVVKVDGEPTVFLYDKRGAEKRIIQPGLTNNRNLTVLEGLRAGDQILMNPPLRFGELPVMPTSSYE